MDPKSNQNEAKWYPCGLPVGSRWPKRSQDGSKGLQEGHKEAPRRPKMAPGGSKMAPREPKTVPRWPHKAPWGSKDGIKRNPWGPNGVPQWRPKEKSWISKKRCFPFVFSMKMTLEELKMAPILIDFGQLGLIWIDSEWFWWFWEVLDWFGVISGVFDGFRSILVDSASPKRKTDGSER